MRCASQQQWRRRPEEEIDFVIWARQERSGGSEPPPLLTSRDVLLGTHPRPSLVSIVRVSSSASDVVVDRSRTSASPLSDAQLHAWDARARTGNARASAAIFDPAKPPRTRSHEAWKAGSLLIDLPAFQTSCSAHPPLLSDSTPFEAAPRRGELARGVEPSQIAPTESLDARKGPWAGAQALRSTTVEVKSRHL